MELAFFRRVRSLFVARLFAGFFLIFFYQSSLSHAQSLDENTYQRFLSDPNFNWTDIEDLFSRHLENGVALQSQQVLNAADPEIVKMITEGREFGRQYLSTLQAESAVSSQGWITDPFREVELMIRKFLKDRKKFEELPASRQTVEMTARGMRATRFPGLSPSARGSELAREARGYQNNKEIVLPEFLTEQKPSVDPKTAFLKLLDNLISKVQSLRDANFDIAARRAPILQSSCRGNILIID